MTYQAAKRLRGVRPPSLRAIASSRITRATQEGTGNRRSTPSRSASASRNSRSKIWLRPVLSVSAGRALCQRRLWQALKGQLGNDRHRAEAARRHVEFGQQGLLHRSQLLQRRQKIRDAPSRHDRDARGERTARPKAGHGKDSCGVPEWQVHQLARQDGDQVETSAKTTEERVTQRLAATVYVSLRPDCPPAGARARSIA
jgi:hypothetical protein